MSACATPFSLQGFPTFVNHISSYYCARNFNIVKLNFFTFLSWRIIRHILTAFSITFVTHLKTNGHPLLGLSSKVFTFDPLFTYILQTSLTVYQFLWLDGQKTVKTDAWALELYSTNSVGLHFHKVVEKITYSGKKRYKHSKKMHFIIIDLNLTFCKGPNMVTFIIINEWKIT